MEPNGTAKPTSDNEPSAPSDKGKSVESAEPKSEERPAAPAHHKSAHKDDEPRSRLAMMLLAFFTVPTGLARVYIGEQIGLVRFWVYVGAVVLSVVPFLNVLAGLVMIVLMVWGVADFFILRTVQEDGVGAPLHTTKRDDKAVSILTILFIIALALVALSIVALIGLTLFGLSLLDSATSPFNTGENYYYDSSY
ncbi:hypothetical protein CR983_03430 [Candidatus Saccharibacteria bacterium]|nr:MAG: hypothetical protein CR983_03430 [Candidatus Saccharibacteria bacterium]